MTEVCFESALRREGAWPLLRRRVRTLQVNVGKVCNQACHHCHVEAGPKRPEAMAQATARRVLDLIAASPSVEVVDVTGGAPELNPWFRSLVRGSRELGRRVVVRCNLTVLFEDGMHDLPAFYRDHDVELVCSLPCYGPDNVDRQRGRGVFDKSIAALQALNAVGYGGPGSDRSLDLVYNPVGAFLPPPQQSLEDTYRDELERGFSIRFRRLLTITNMPIKRFAEALAKAGEHERYMGLLVAHFNAATIDGLMCRDLVSVGWEGSLYDCDFHQMADIAIATATGPASIWNVASLEELAGTGIAPAPHCFGCTAGAGSSCGGALAVPAASAGEREAAPTRASR